MSNRTLLVIAPPKGRDCIFYLIVAETGEALSSHFCSNESYAYIDLYASRDKRIEEWTKRFGEFEVKYLDQTDITEEQLIERNKKWFQSLKEG